MDAPVQRLRREDVKRTKLCPTDDARSDSSLPSSGSVSEASALRSTPPASEHTRHSSFSSLHSSRYDDSESSLSNSSSSVESSDSDTDDETVVTLGGPKKPPIATEAILQGAQDLQMRLAALLPRLAAANDDLAAHGDTVNMEEVDDGEQHIEMDLGLGVLEEVRDDTSTSSDESADGDDELSEEDEDEVRISSGPVKRPAAGRSAGVMKKLLGQQTVRRRAGIEDLG